MSMSAYICIPICIFLLLGIFIPFFSIKRLPIVYSALILFFIILMVLIDLYSYKAWGYRLDAGFLKYLNNPSEAYASIGNLPVFRLVIIFFICWVISIWGINRFIVRNFNLIPLNQFKWQNVLGLLFIMGIAIIPIRGGLQLAPLNQSGVYFSNNNFSNISAINASWNFMYTLNHHTDNTVNPYIYLETARANKIEDSLYHSSSVSSLKFNMPKKNVIILVWESFTEKALHIEKDGKVITPGFNQLKNEGIYFSDIFASGDRTDKGIVAVLSGYPSQPTTSIVKVPSKASKLPILSKEFKMEGYNTAFYYGGELEFANMKAYLTGGNFDKYVTVSNFRNEDKNSKWGAHDGVVGDKFLRDILLEKEPFFYVWLTLSSHEPFETPVPVTIIGDDDGSKFLNSLHYTDSIVFSLINEFKKQIWWKNTIVAIVADHGHRMPSTGKKIDDFKIPMLLIGGGLKPSIIDKTGSQTDLAATLLNELGMDYKKYDWSKNLLDSTINPWAYFSFNNGFGFINNSNKYIVFDNTGKFIIEQTGNVDSSLIFAGKAMQQLSFQSYLDK
ncbi:MAG: LTA synthase family protein [Ferruginibacter sp.]|nr:LTA synthase family protein [Ferruginibacter sp.]